MPLRQLVPDAGSADTAKVDIIAVHGLNPRSKSDAAHAWDTWRTPAGPDGRLWLRDDLPQHLPDARVFLYEYNATAVYGRDRDTFVGKANELLEAIRIERDDVEARPILFFGHSMGGLLVKQALINAHNNKKYMSIKGATRGLAFFATPHNGGDSKLVSLGKLTSKIATKAGFQKGDDVLEVLKSGSMFSDLMQEHWRHQPLEYDIVSFWGGLDSIVPWESARLGLPGDRENVVKLNADHSGVCKFETEQTDQGRETVRHILVFCPRERERREYLVQALGQPIDTDRMLSTPGKAGIIARWLLRSGRLGMFQLANQIIS
jgi:hypothetical protein